MANSNTLAGSDDLSLRWITLPAGLYLAVHLIAPVLPARFWGVDGLTYLPIWYVLPFVLAFLIVLTPSFRQPVARVFLVSVPRILGDNRRSIAFRLVILCGVFIVLSSLFASATPLLGDGQLHIRRLGGGSWDPRPSIDRAPLVFWIMHRVYRWVISIGSPADTYAWVSQFAGIAFLVLSVVACRVFVSERSAQYAMFLVLITQGYVQLFFGYVETYPILFPMMLALLLLCQMCLEGRVPVWVAGIVLGITVTMHLVTLALTPALAWVALRRPGRSKAGVVVSVASLAVIPVTASIMLALIGLPFDTFLHFEPDSHTLPLTGTVLQHQAHTLLSWNHAVEVWNQYALVAPAFLICLGLVR